MGGARLASSTCFYLSPTLRILATSSGVNSCFSRLFIWKLSASSSALLLLLLFCIRS